MKASEKSYPLTQSLSPAKFQLSAPKYVGIRAFQWNGFKNLIDKGKTTYLP